MSTRPRAPLDLNGQWPSSCPRPVPFAGYSIDFPELFPIRLCGTGVGFCDNTVRYLAGPAPVLVGMLTITMSCRSAAMLMSTVYLVGTVALIWAPETKGRQLPKD